MSEFDCGGCTTPQLLGLRSLQHKILESVARDLPVRLVMNRLCRHVEQLAPEVICTILAVDADGRLRPLAAPSLPKEYSDALDGLRIGPAVGSCGTAAFRGEPVEAADIETDRLWSDYKALVLPLGLAACWSSPIRAADGRVVGTFAFYYRSKRGPSVLDRTIVRTCVNLCAIAFEQDERKASIHRLAYFDSLTGVPNRASFEQYGKEAIAAAREYGGDLAVLWIDLDNFKSVNDTLGHQAGDQALKAMARRFEGTLDSGAFLARIGGDEFAVLQPSAPCREEVERLARRLAAAADQSIDLGGGAFVRIGASIGVAHARSDGCDLSEFMKKADLALYDAKTLGGKRFSFFDAEIETRIASQRRLEQDLERALSRNEFELHFQPIVDLGALAITGFEALLRWRRPGHGLLAPQRFLAAAERAGMICEIGEWVLKEACTLAASLPGEMRVAVNLSPTQLSTPGFAPHVARVLAQARLSPRRLELEITESALFQENSTTLKCLRDIRQLGVSIALDDFGTGFSALSHLRAFPVDRLKIDQSFVQEADVSPDTASIIRALVGLARDLGLKTTAEGIETPAQLRSLHRLGCDEIQGYLVGRPKPLDALRAFLEKDGARSGALEALAAPKSRVG
jgi:diguanylate cyclase (GGDEF)-like protein